MAFHNQRMRFYDTMIF